jgi:hypothetical protein
MKHFVLIAAAVAASSATAFGVATVTPPTFGTTPYSCSVPVVASNGSTFLTLWTVDTGLGGKHVYGALADAEGASIGSAPFLVMTDAAVVGLFAQGAEYLAFVSDRNRRRDAKPQWRSPSFHLLHELLESYADGRPDLHTRRRCNPRRRVPRQHIRRGCGAVR